MVQFLDRCLVHFLYLHQLLSVGLLECDMRPQEGKHGACSQATVPASRFIGRGALVMHFDLSGSAP